MRRGKNIIERLIDINKIKETGFQVLQLCMFKSNYSVSFDNFSLFITVILELQQFEIFCFN